VLKQGRSIVDKKQVDNTEELTKLLDNLKQKYNELGSRVTSAKNDLEKAFKLTKRFKREQNLILDFLNKIDGELRKIEQKPLSKNYNDELDWIKNTKTEITKVENINLENMKQLKKQLEETMSKSQNSENTSNNGPSLSFQKLDEIEQKIDNIQQRIDERAEFLHEQAKKLDESYESYFFKSKQILTQIEQLNNDLIDAERSNSRDDVKVGKLLF
jgi:hypothetical protein